MENKEQLEKVYKDNYDCALKYCQQKNWTEARKSLETAGFAILKINQLVNGVEKERFLAKTKSLTTLLLEVKARENQPNEELLKAEEKSIELQQEEVEMPKPTLEEALKELDELEGLEGVKKDILEYVEILKIRQERASSGFLTPQLPYHMIFKGDNPLKLAVARLLAKILYSLDILAKDKVVRISVFELLGNYVGESSKRTQKALDDAKGGFLFIDGLYKFFDPHSCYGNEILGTLYASMDEYFDKKKEEVTFQIYSGDEEEISQFDRACGMSLAIKIWLTLDFDKN